MKKAVIFDLDGTLWDATENLVEPWNIALSGYDDVNVTLTHDDLMSFMGKTVEEISEMIIPHIDYDRRIEIVTRGADLGTEYLKTHGGTLYSGLLKTLAVLKEKYMLFIVSNCLDGYIQSFCSYHNLSQYFDDFECQKTGLSKGENIKLIIRRNNIDKAVYVGDTESDYNSAEIAGIPFIHASYGFGKIDADVPTISAVNELPKILEKML